MSLHSPCKDCSDRFVGCHAQCDLYESFRENLEQIAQNRKREMVEHAFQMDRILQRQGKVRRKY